MAQARDLFSQQQRLRPFVYCSPPPPPGELTIVAKVMALSEGEQNFKRTKQKSKRANYDDNVVNGLRNN